jgi:SAM-dependent methyltransferase
MVNERDRQPDSIYSDPRVVDRLDDCYFYHSMDLPQHGFVAGPWDLRPGIERYLGNVEFRGKRVLDIGTASGFLAFWMERQGAEVIGFDISEKYSRDLVPFEGGIDPEESASWGAHIRKLNNSFWFTRALLGSKAQMVYGTVYDIPEAIGQVDIVTFGAVLLHLRDPFLALQSALRITTETVIVAEGISRHSIPLTLLRLLKPTVVFLPNARKASPRDTWWALPPQTIVEFLKVLGFQRTHVNYHVQLYRGKRRPMYTVVGRRTSQTKG